MCSTRCSGPRTWPPAPMPPGCGSSSTRSPRSPIPQPPPGMPGCAEGRPAARKERTVAAESAYVIVGASLAGAKAAQTLREEGFDGPLVLVGEDEHRPYQRPPLSKDY